jgi:hypothetical protein
MCWRQQNRLSCKAVFEDAGCEAVKPADVAGDGQISKNLSSPFCKNILLFCERKSAAYLASSRAHKRGVSRSSRTLVREAMDADALVTNSARADGEVVWS